MSPRERAFWLAAQKRASILEPEIAKALLRAFAILRENLSEAEFARFIASGNVEAFVAEALSPETIDRAFIPVRRRIREGVEQNVRYFAKSLPGQGKVDGVIAVEFNVLNPRTIDAIRALDTKVIQSLGDDTRTAVRQAVEQGLRDGKNPRAIAKEVRASVGLSPRQAQNAAGYEAKLRAEHKYTDAQIEKRVATYTRKAVSLNAETVSRTASLDAMKAGQRLSWDDAIEKGVVDRNRLTKTWRGVMDDRERPTHVAMEGETVPFDSPFSNGQMIPGDTEYNCRCTPIYRVA